MLTLAEIELRCKATGWVHPALPLGQVEQCFELPAVDRFGQGGVALEHHLDAAIVGQITTDYNGQRPRSQGMDIVEELGATTVGDPSLVGRALRRAIPWAVVTGVLISAATIALSFIVGSEH